jgi:hypothetical protein
MKGCRKRVGVEPTFEAREGLSGLDLTGTTLADSSPAVTQSRRYFMNSRTRNAISSAAVSSAKWPPSTMWISAFGTSRR